MSVKVGRLASVKKGTFVVAELGQWSLSGFQRDVLESTAFGDSIKRYEVGLGDYGTISFSGNYDPTDTNGQSVLATACKNATTITDLYFYIDAASYWKVSGGSILLTKCDAVSFDKAGIGTVSFEGRITGGSMVLV